MTKSADRTAAKSARHESLSPRRRKIATILTVAVLAGPVLASTGGCRLCADCDLESYPSYGGAWQRTLRDSGRVGSLFDPGGSRASDLSARVDSDAADERYRDRISGDEDAEPEESAETPDDSPERTDDEERDLQLDDSDLREMQDRYRDLELQDIDYEDAGGQPQVW
ncbi:hypothetical protein [Rhodopirellula sallentina]|uniref:Putative secreted protein n=1 Tax=Rhodopirellula sallentina SM41 TaxID=1263870 RepID=M5U4S5_9BACT|nr:hypothetical protein [Rhodopirellula sallentina]EMI56462.1 putative secreted protein [Rhodopirellula sallentina SM41]